MSITDKIGSFDFWGMLIPGCTTVWGIRIICIECDTIHAYYSNWHAMPWMHNDLFKWSVFILAGYIVGLAISIIMDCIWEMLGWRNNPKSILKALDVQKKRNPVLYTPQIFNDMKTDAVITYYTMYNEVDEKYPNNPISSLERQVAFMRNMIIPIIVLIIAFMTQKEMIATTLLGIMVAGLICLTIVRQLKIYQVVLEYYATLPEMMEHKSKKKTIMNTIQVVTNAEKKTTTQKVKAMCYNIKEFHDRNKICCWVEIIILIGAIMFWAMYLPKVQNVLSGNSADWGNFGAFFWGFGTMCFTLLNVIVFYIISQRLYWKQFYDTYRTALEKVLDNLVEDSHRSDQTNIKKEHLGTHMSLVNMMGVLGGINNVSAYNTSVKNQAAYLVSRIQNYQNKRDNDELASLVGELAAYQICLITNGHLDIQEQNNGIADAQINK